MRILVPLAIAACAPSAPAPAPATKLPAPFTELPLAGAPDGLSGLAVDAQGVLWAVAERAKQLARITLDPTGTRATVEKLPISAVPPETDLEGIEVLPDGALAIAAEGQHAGVASLLRADPDAGAGGSRITHAMELPAARLGVELTPNHGAESVCGDAHALVVGIEIVGTDDAGRRYAPMVRIVDGAVVAVQRLWLTSDTGKIGALDCRIAADGAVTGWGIERHYGVTRVVRVALPPPGTAGDQGEATLILDLEPWLHGRLNLEGIAALPDGRVVIINDNATARTTGATELLVFPTGALGAR